jgi:hypothetical protein
MAGSNRSTNSAALVIIRQLRHPVEGRGWALLHRVADSKPNPVLRRDDGLEVGHDGVM